MPTKSKIASTRLKPDKGRYDDRTAFYCSRCSRPPYKKQKGNFPASQSPLYKGNNGYLTVCRHCVHEVYEHYKSLMEEHEAIHRICLKFDIYWNPEIYAMLNKASTSASRVLSYISKTNLYKYVGKTYDDTMDEETAEQQARDAAEGPIQTLEEISGSAEPLVDPESVQFWGVGFRPEEYEDLDARYKRWATGYEQCKTVAEESLLKQIVLSEWRITRESQKGGKTEGLINAFNSLLGSANLKPVQNKEPSVADEHNTFGTLIRVWENERPIPDPDPEFKDVDGIIKYISIWFLGHLCKMLRINNSYSRLYEAEMENLRVEKPEYEDEDDEQMFEDMFGGDATES